ncbi:NADPH-dependent F420 reductase [Pseudonocardia xishanensis]|uniref:NAD(P)-binding domain-containing protein n=1 Tax=Pseudonocardia xishanensis TaxID=630995 RepID=A0ABP8RW14_9PSEU
MGGISIIGLGGMARALAERALAGGHVVEVIGRDPAKAEKFAAELGGRAMTGTFGATPAGDIVILAVPHAGGVPVVEQYGDALVGKVVVDISNTFAGADDTTLVTPEGTSAGQQIAEALPASAHVVKAFNTVFGHVLAQGGRLDVFLAGDDAAAKASVAAFVESLGLTPRDVGGLAMAHWLEGAGLLLMGLARSGAGFNVALGAQILD